MKNLIFTLPQNPMVGGGSLRVYVVTDYKGRQYPVTAYTFMQVWVRLLKLMGSEMSLFEFSDTGLFSIKILPGQDPWSPKKA
jgi:hypothetical protein